LSLRLSSLKVPDTPALHSTFACRRPRLVLVERRSDGFAPLRQLRLVDPLATQSRAQLLRGVTAAGTSRILS
jgi:hypothetical protein